MKHVASIVRFPRTQNITEQLPAATPAAKPEGDGRDDDVSIRVAMRHEVTSVDVEISRRR